MEERIIDDEYGRGIKLRKTKDGYVDVTDELSEKERAEASGRDEEAAEGFELTADGAEEETEESLVTDIPEEDLEESLEDLAAEEEGEGGGGSPLSFPSWRRTTRTSSNLTPEEAIALRKKKEEEEAAAQGGLQAFLRGGGGAHPFGELQGRRAEIREGASA